jgi:hypothetical protein
MTSNKPEEKRKPAKPGSKRYQLEKLANQGNIVNREVSNPAVYLERQVCILMFSNMASLMHMLEGVHNHYEGHELFTQAVF